MTSDKKIRCHITDREDQVDECKEALVYLAKRTAELEGAVKTAQEALAAHHRRIVNVNKFKEDIEATLHIHWLNDPPY